MIHISHRLEEIHQIADRVTVLRDGERVDTKPTSEVTKQQIINMMVGRVIYEQPKSKSAVAAEAPVVLRVNRLNAGKLVRDVSFELREGEILGLAGLDGSGQDRDGAGDLRRRRGPGRDDRDPRPAGLHPIARRRRGERHRLPLRGPQALRPGDQPSVKDNMAMATYECFSAASSSTRKGSGRSARNTSIS